LLPIHDENRPTIKPYVNYGLLLVNVVVFFFFFLQGTRVLENGIWDFGAIPHDIIQGKNPWTLLTSMFMHADIMHLLGNMVYLWVFGDNIEDALGHTKYLVFYLLGGLAATFAHIASVLAALPSLTRVWYIDPTRIPSVGASGAISAVLGAYILLYPRARVRTLLFSFFITIITIPALYYLGFWFLYQLLLGFFSFTGLFSGVAFWAHIGGFVAGLAVVKAFGVRPRPRRGVMARGEPFKPLYVSPRFRTPFVDVMVEGDRVKVLAELPGVEEGDVMVRVSGWELVVSAEHGETGFYKRIVLPFMVSSEIPDFDFRNGVLSFTLYKMTQSV
jgi:membrane associated rhomboid family serine protease/HSP20 family molecular chaperone IbpA